MNNKSISVLVLDGPGRQILPVLAGLHSIGCNITTFNYSKLDNGYTSRYPQNKLLFTGISQDLEAIKRNVDAEIKSGKYDVIIPLGDVMTQFLSENKTEYSKYINLAVPDYDVFMLAFDKQKTMEICQREGIACTRTKFETESIEEFIERIGGYPIVIKPKSGFGSIGFHCIKDSDDFNKTVKFGNIDLTKCVIQEYVDQKGKQYNVHAFMDQNEEIAYIVPTQKCRWFPVDGGSSCFCRSVNREDLVEQCTKLLKKVHWRGCCEIELIEDPSTGEIKVMEINGRTSACVKICQLLGINIAKNMVELSLNKRVSKQLPKFKDVRMRCIHTDLLWLIKSSNRFNTNPHWFNNIHTHDQIFSVFDPLPFIGFSLQSLMKLKKELRNRSR